MANNPEALFRRPDVLKMTGINSTSHLYALMKKGAFPRPRKISARSVGWRASDIDAWISSRPLAA